MCPKIKSVLFFNEWLYLQVIVAAGVTDTGGVVQSTVVTGGEVMEGITEVRHVTKQ